MHSVSASELPEFPRLIYFLFLFFFEVGKVDVSQGYRLFWKIRGSLTMVAMI